VLGPDDRLRFLINKLTEHLHDFARETALTTDEWMAALQFLTTTGQICTSTRQEFILLSDVLGLSVLVDALNHPKPPGATENTVLGPFFTEDANDLALGESIVHDVGEEKYCLVKGKVTDENGVPLEGAVIEVWETDETGHYDTQYSDRSGPDYRGRLKSDEEGNFWFKAIRPVPYPIPHDGMLPLGVRLMLGPVGKLLKRLNRHPYRPSHMHFMIIAEGYDTLVTALYVKGDPFETSDAVFGVKSSLIIDVKTVDSEEVASKYGVAVGDWLIDWDFVRSCWGVC
jgi:protocatechuate 3,4-dioxygenase beta subunit